MNLARLPEGLDDGHAQPVEGAATLSLVGFAAARIAIADTGVAATATNGKSHLVVRCRHNPARIIDDVDDDGTGIPAIRDEPLLVENKSG